MKYFNNISCEAGLIMSCHGTFYQLRLCIMGICYSVLVLVFFFPYWLNLKDIIIKYSSLPLSPLRAVKKNLMWKTQPDLIDRSKRGFLIQDLSATFFVVAFFQQVYLPPSSGCLSGSTPCVLFWQFCIFDLIAYLFTVEKNKVNTFFSERILKIMAHLIIPSLIQKKTSREYNSSQSFF